MRDTFVPPDEVVKLMSSAATASDCLGGGRPQQAWVTGVLT